MRKLTLPAWIVGIVLALSACHAQEFAVGSTVKVVLASGHGSGVHVGHGYVLTAAHVVGDNKTVKVQFEDRSVLPADVMWANAAKDVALIRFKDNGRAASSNLSCRIAAPGERVTALGSPMWMENLSFEGRINGAPLSVTTLSDVLPADMTILPGMSGGGVFDADGNVIGISVAHALVPVGFTSSWTRVGLIVPGKTICDLMGRSV